MLNTLSLKKLCQMNQMKIQEITLTSFSVAFSTSGRMMDHLAVVKIHRHGAAGADYGLRGRRHPELV